MKLIHVFTAFLFIHFISCGKKTTAEPPVKVYSVNDELLEQVARISSEALYCDGSLSSEGPNSVTGRPDCRNGDSMLWSGLYYSAYPKAEVGAAIRNSIGPDNRPYRSPENRAGNDDINSFSRDMWTGFMAFCSRAKQWEVCNAVWDYTKDHDYRMCPRDTDDRCLLTPSMMYMTGWVWGANGWYISPVARASQTERYLDEQTTIKSAKEVELGYRLHLIVARVYILQRVGALTESYKEAAKIAYQRDPGDLFYQWVWASVSGDGNLQQDIATKLLAHMKSWQRPQGYSQWVWGDTVKRDGSNTSRMHESMGHDLVFLACNIVECK
jgi:hypothetical protein